MSNTPLYRPEAKDALKVRLEGEVVALEPPSLRKLSLALGLALVVLVAFGSTATYTRYTSASGMLAPQEGLITVTAPFRGDIVSIQGKQGQQIAAGQSLAVLVNSQLRSDGLDTYSRDQQLLDSRKSIAKELHRAKSAELAQASLAASGRLAGARQTHAAAVAASKAANDKSTASRKYLEQQRTLVEKGYLAAAGISPYEQAHLSDLQVARQSDQNQSTMLQEIVAAEHALAQLRTQGATLAAQEADSKAMLEIDASRLAASSEAMISSSLAGTLSAVPALKGPVAAGTPLFVIAPPGPTYAHLWLSEAAAQKSKVGQRVTLQVMSQAPADSTKLRGTLTTLSNAPVPVRTSKGESQGYLALVLLDDQQAIKAPLGARVDARLQIETKTLIGWIADPLVRGLRQANLNN